MRTPPGSSNGGDRVRDAIRLGGETAPGEGAGKPPGGGEGALQFTAWGDRWFPDAFSFGAIDGVIVTAGALANGASVTSVTKAFGDGFWRLTSLTMHLAFGAIGEHVVATSRSVQRLIERFALSPNGDRGAVGFIAAVSMISSLLSGEP